MNIYKSLALLLLERTPRFFIVELKKRLGWRNRILSQFLNRHKKSDELTDIYQFGVFSGMSICEIIYIFSKNKFEFRKIFGFDSFCGLPEEKNEEIQNGWVKGSFSSVDYFKKDKTISIEEAITALKKFIENHSNKKYHKNIEFIDGFFADTFLKIEKSPSLLKKFSPACYVDIDVDIYSSAKEVLKFMLKNKLIRRNTLIGYDDWGATTGYENYESGESRAHKEIIEEYNMDCELIASYGNFKKDASRIYLVKDVQ